MKSFIKDVSKNLFGMIVIFLIIAIIAAPGIWEGQILYRGHYATFGVLVVAQTICTAVIVTLMDRFRIPARWM